MVLIVCMFAECRFAVHAETEEKDKDVTLAPYFFIQDGDPSVDSFPLKGTEVETNINGTIAETYVTQTYENEGERPLSASYVFPASTKVSKPAFISSVTPPHRTACSPKRSVSVSSLNVVSKIPALPAPIPLA